MTMWVTPSAMAALIWASMSSSELPSVIGPCKVTTAMASGNFSMVALSGISTLYPTQGMAGRQVSCGQPNGWRALLPLPHFGDCAAFGIDFVFEGGADIVELGKFL